MFSKSYIARLLESALGAAAAAFLPFIAGDAVDLWHVDWKIAAGAAGAAAAASVLKSLVSRSVGDPDSGSVTK